MNIIIQGDLKSTRRIIRFTCRECGCVFEADKDEYKYCFNHIDGECSSINCPCCGETVYGSYVEVK